MSKVIPATQPSLFNGIDTRACHRCSVEKPSDEFINRRGRPVQECLDCRRRLWKRQSQKYQVRKDAGLCILCASASRPGMVTCEMCAHKNVERLRKRSVTLMGKSLCIQCKNPTQIANQRHCNKCLAKLSAATRRRQNRWRREGKCMGCGEPRSGLTERLCQKCTVLRRQRLREKKDALRMDVYAAYGGAICACCGESELAFLTLDHKHGDGAKHRREMNVRGGGLSMYRWIIRNNFPPLFQVLCFNCNVGRHINGGVCPHKQRWVENASE